MYLFGFFSSLKWKFLRMFLNKCKFCKSKMKYLGSCFLSRKYKMNVTFIWKNTKPFSKYFWFLCLLSKITQIFPQSKQCTLTESCRLVLINWNAEQQTRDWVAKYIKPEPRLCTPWVFFKHIFLSPSSLPLGEEEISGHGNPETIPSCCFLWMGAAELWGKVQSPLQAQCLFQATSLCPQYIAGSYSTLGN